MRKAEQKARAQFGDEFVDAVNAEAERRKSAEPTTIPEIRPDWQDAQRVRVIEALTAKGLAAIARRDASALHHIVRQAYNVAALNREVLNSADNLSQLLMALSNPER